MNLAVDVNYTNHTAIAAGIFFQEWDDEEPSKELITQINNVNEYEPGNFYKRELPCILALMKENLLHPDCIIIDGDVFLDGSSIPGLGKHLFDVLDDEIPVIGVAKSAFKDIPAEFELYRGKSVKPLYVTTVGMSIESAKNNIMRMHGESRNPTLLKRADQVSKSIATMKK